MSARAGLSAYGRRRDCREVHWARRAPSPCLCRCIRPRGARYQRYLPDLKCRLLVSGAFNQIARQIGRAQQQQLEIIHLVARQAEAISARAKVRDHDVERHNEYARAIEQLLQGQMKIAQFADDLASQYGRLFKALSNRLDAVEKEAFGSSDDRETSTPPLN
jgi:hypothetical protein